MLVFWDLVEICSARKSRFISVAAYRQDMILTKHTYERRG